MRKKFSILLLAVCLALCTSIACAASSPAKTDSTNINLSDTTKWGFATASDRLITPEGDTVKTVSAAIWMIHELAHPDTVLPDSLTTYRLLLMSYSALSRNAVPAILPQLLIGIENDSKGVRNFSISGIFSLALAHDKPSQAALRAIAKQTKWEDIQKQAAYFLDKIARYKKQGGQY